MVVGNLVANQGTLLGNGLNVGIPAALNVGHPNMGLGNHGLGMGIPGQDYLVLILDDNLGAQGRLTHYKIRPTTKLGKLMRFHCGMMGQTLAWTRFVVRGKGVHLSQSDTAADIGIVDGDHITAVFHSYSIVSQSSSS